MYVWLPGVWEVEVFGLAAVLLMSPKFQLQAVPAPPEASVKFTVRGGSARLGGFGIVSMAGVGGMQLGLPMPVNPDFTGNTADDETLTDPPRMAEMTGVMTWNLQVNDTAALSPIPVLRGSPVASVNVGDGGVAGSNRQFDAAASLRIWLLYLVIVTVLAGLVVDQAVELFAAKLAAARVMFWRLIQPR